MGETKTVDLEIVRGDTLKISLEFVKELEDGTTVPDDISNTVISFTVKPDYVTKDEDAPINKDFVASMYEVSSGVVVLIVDTSNLEAKTYLYDVQAVKYSPDGVPIEIRTLLIGKLKVKPDVTKRISQIL